MLIFRKTSKPTQRILSQNFLVLFINLESKKRENGLTEAMINLCLDKARSKTPTTFIGESSSEKSNNFYRQNSSTTIDQQQYNASMNSRTNTFTPDSIYSFSTKSNASNRNSRDTKANYSSLSRSKTPGPDFGSTFSASSHRSHTVKPRSKTPTATDFSSYRHKFDRC